MAATGQENLAQTGQPLREQEWVPHGRSIYDPAVAQSLAVQLCYRGVAMPAESRPYASCWWSFPARLQLHNPPHRHHFTADARAVSGRWEPHTRS